MILPLDNTRLEAGIKAYIDDQYDQRGVTVPVPNAEAGPAPRQMPKVIPGLSLVEFEATEPTVAILAKQLPTEVDGWYSPRVSIAAVTPVMVEGITDADHVSFYGELLACFPGRPAADGLPADLVTWNALEASLSAHVLAASGYNVSGWKVDQGAYSKNKKQIEQVLVITIGVIHPDLS